MIMVQSAPKLPSPPSFSHRRAPSAPVVVAATEVPGLLSLSKPAPAPRPQQQARQRSPKSKPAQQQRSPQPAKAVAAPVDAPASEPKPSRGHQSGKANKARSTSPPARRNHQPSPSPAEAPTASPKAHRKAASAVLDPFLSSPAAAKAAAPKLNVRPSGKLARRRGQPQAPDSPTPARAQAIPVPPRTHSNGAGDGMSRSETDAVPFPASTRPAPRRTSTLPSGVFPVCDDLESDADDAAALSPDATAAFWAQLGVGEDSPRTAPLHGAFGVPATPVRPRVPSAGNSVFGMAFDEDWPSSASTSVTSLNTPLDERPAQLMYGLLPSPTRGSKASAQGVRPGGKRAQFYASSEFQNSPSPDELPIPAF